MNKKKNTKVINNFYKNKKILVTGASGFKGAWLCFWLHLMGSKVYGIGYSPNKNKNLFYQLGLNKLIKYSLIDIRNFKKLKKKITLINPEIVFHMAAQPLIFEGYKKPFETYFINSFGTLSILEILKNLKVVKSIVCITSDKCYESNNSQKGFIESDKLGGEDPYSGSKACAEIISKTYYKSFFLNKKNCGIATARAGNVIGGGDWSGNRLIPDSIKSIMNNKTINLRNPYFNRPWLHVLEPLNGYIILAKNLYEKPSKFSGPWNFGSKKNTVTDVLTIVQAIIKNWGSGKVKFVKKKRYYEQENLQLNIEKSQKNLSWKPKLSIKKSVEITVDWYKNVLQKKNSAKEMTKKQILEYINRD
jgi:CDP-glucose 4,6-dehydratase